VLCAGRGRSGLTITSWHLYSSSKNSKTTLGMNTSNDQAGVLELAQLVADLGSTKPEVPERAATLLHKKAKLTQQHATMANTPGLIAGLLRVAGSGSSSSGSSSSGSSSSGSSSGSNSTDAAKMAAMTAVVDICWNARKEEVWQEEPALVQQLVDLASSQHPEVQVRALKALWYLAMVPANSRLIAEVGGAIPMLAGFLSSSGTKWAPSAATRVLWHVSQERTAAQRIAETPGAVQALLGLLGAGDKPLQQKLAADTLCNLAQSEFTAQQQGTIRGLVVLPLLVEMLKSEAPGVQLAAADVVVQLVTREPSCRQRLAQEPGLMEGFMDAVDRGGKQLPVGTQEQAQAAVELLLEEATRKEVTHADVTQQVCECHSNTFAAHAAVACSLHCLHPLDHVTPTVHPVLPPLSSQAPRTRLILPLLPLVVGSCLLLAGPLLVVYGLLAAGTASAAPSSHNTDLLVVTGGVWALVKGAALVAASVTTAVTHHLTLLADSLERCLTRGSMVAGGVWLLRGGMYVVAAGAKVLTADHCPNQGTRLLLATSTLIAAAAGLCVVAVGVWLLSEALGAPFPWSAGRALLGHCKEAVKQVRCMCPCTLQYGMTAVTALESHKHVFKPLPSSLRPQIMCTCDYPCLEL
jgi:hypothetical protein